MIFVQQGPGCLPRQKAAEVCTPGPQPSDGDRTCTHQHGNVMFGINRKQTDTLSEVRMYNLGSYVSSVFDLLERF